MQTPMSSLSQPQRLDQLGPDILENILLKLHDSSRASLFALLIINRTFYEITLPFVLRHCHFDVSRSATLPRIYLLLQDETALRHVRMLTFSGDHWFGGEPGEPSGDCGALVQYDSPTNWDPISRLISRLVNLTELTICTENLRFPLNVLAALHAHHPCARLSLYNWTHPTCADASILSEEEKELARSPCLRLIHAKDYCLNYRDRQKTFERIACAAPNLEVMSTTGNCFCTSYSSRYDIESEISKDTSEFVRRKELKKIELEGACLDVHSLDYFSAFAQLDRLTSLLGVSPNPEFLHAAARGSEGGQNIFSSLKHLKFFLNLREFTSAELAPALNLFLSTCPGLTSLALIIPSSKDTWPLSFIWPTILSHHGASLRALQIHQAETLLKGQRPRVCLTVDELHQLSQHAPHLEDFEFDVDRVGNEYGPAGYEKTIYTGLASFRSLRSITIRMDRGLVRRRSDSSSPSSSSTASDISYSSSTGSGWIYNPIDKTCARRIWDMLVLKHHLSTLSELVLQHGEQFRTLYRQADGNWKRYRIRRNERDDRPADGVEIEYDSPPSLFCMPSYRGEL